MQVQDILAKYQLFGTFSDCSNVIAICKIISKRAAKIVASMLCGIVLKITEFRRKSNEMSNQNRYWRGRELGVVLLVDNFLSIRANFLPRFFSLSRPTKTSL